VIFRERAIRMSSAPRLALCIFGFAAAAWPQNGTITITSGPTLPAAVTGQPYTVQLAATGGDPTSYYWSIQSTNASWLQQSSEGSPLLTGTPPAAPLGTQYQLTVVVSDSLEDSSQPTTLTIPLGSPAAAIQITPVTIPPAEVNQPYSYQFSATGASQINWSLQGAPSWLTIPGGVLSGTPPAAGTFGITVVASAGGSTASVAEEFTIYPALAIAGATLPPAIVNVPYSQQIAVSGGASRAYTLSASGLPPGLGIANNGTLSGTPTAAGAFSISVTAKDVAGYMTTGAFPLTVAPALSISPSSLPAATLGAPYSQTLSASGGAGGYSWTASGFPAGLALASTGQVSGTPNAGGSFPVSVTVKDSGGDSATISFTLVVTGSLQITTKGLPAGNVGVSYSAPLSASGANGSVTWSQTSGALPSGLTLSSTGAISGTPSAVGDSTFTVQALDSTGLSVSASFTIHISPPPNSTLTVSLPPSLAPGSQPAISIALSPAYPLPLTATAALAISPDLSGPTDLGFSNGARTIQFTIPADTAQYQLPFSTGTSAGTITATLNVDTTGQSVTVAGSLVLTGQIGAQPPSIRSVTATGSGSALTVVVTGFSSTRDMKTAAFHFTPAAGASLASTDFTTDVSSIFTTWYANPSSFATGSQFKLTMPFTITGSLSSISSVTVTLTNSNAASTPATATVQ
jgi:large repetitive protein